MESINEIIHKEKKQKKTTDKSPIVSSLLDSSTVVKDNTTVKSLPEQIEEHLNRHKLIGQQKLRNAEKNRKLIRNAEIDEQLQGWVMEGLVNPDFMKWIAMCCHKLGLQRVNQIAINARGGKQPQRLFSSLLSANMKLQAKRDYYSITDTNPDTAHAMVNDLDI